MPMGGIIAPRRVFEHWPPGAHGTTFGGNPLACAAALATLDVLEEGGLFERAASLGERVLARLRAATSGNDAVLDVRGIGLMVGAAVASSASTATMLASQPCGNTTRKHSIPSAASWVVRPPASCSPSGVRAWASSARVTPASTSSSATFSGSPSGPPGASTWR